MELSNLGLALTLLYRWTEDSAPLADAATALREAVTLTPPGHHHHAICLSNLGDALDLMFDQTGDLDLLEEAVQAHRDALAATSPRSPLRTRLLASLNIGLRNYSNRPGILTSWRKRSRQSGSAWRPPLALHLSARSIWAFSARAWATCSRRREISTS